MNAAGRIPSHGMRNEMRRSSYADLTPPAPLSPDRAGGKLFFSLSSPLSPDRAATMR